MAQLTDALDDYLGTRRALGFKLERLGKELAGFVAYAEQLGAETITSELAVAWATQPAGRSPIWWRIRLSAVRGFALHRQAFDPRTEVPPMDAVPSVPGSHRAVPYFYSEAEIARLMEEAGKLAHPLHAATYQTFIGLLAVTGMRRGEAIRLHRADVDWSNGILTIRSSKFGKSREIPLAPSTVTALKHYQAKRELLCARPTASQCFFVSIRGTGLTEVNRTFRHLVTKAQIRPRSTRGRPRLHDLRHSFAIRTLVAWYHDGRDVQALLPRLSTYLGHANPIHTYWYLSAEPELLALASARLEQSGEEES